MAELRLGGISPKMRLSQLLTWTESRRFWAKLKPGSQQVYRTLLRQGVTLLGEDIDASTVRAEEADSLYDRLESQYGTHKAVSVCVVLRKVWNELVRYEQVSTNPFTHMGLGSVSDRKVIWTKDQIDRFCKASVQYGLPSLGLLLTFCYTFGQRPGDMRQLRWNQYDGEYLYYIQQKTGKQMVSSVPESLREVIDSLDKVGPFIISREDTEQPYTEDDYLWHYKNILKLAGLPNNLQLRDARKTAITEMGELGATDSELQALGGHDTRQTLNTYQKTTKKLADNVSRMRFPS